MDVQMSDGLALARKHCIAALVKNDDPARAEDVDAGRQVS